MTQKEFKKILKSMDIEKVTKFKIIICDKGYDSKENHIAVKKLWIFCDNT